MYFIVFLYGLMNFYGKLINFKLNAFLDIRKIFFYEIIYKVY